MTQPLLIVIASPYRSGTSDDPERIDANLRAMTDMALRVFHAGHLPVGGEWLALPLIRARRVTRRRRRVFDEILPHCPPSGSALRRRPAHGRPIAERR